MNENDQETVLTLLAQIKLACLDDEIYHQILCDLILKGNAAERMPLCAAMTSISEYLKPENKCQQPVEEMLCQELHQSWKKIYGAVVAPDSLQGMANTLPAMLAWGYETKQLNKKSAELYCRLNQLNVQQLAAFWKAIEISGIESISGLRNFAEQRSDAWQISCDVIAKSHRTSFIFGGASPSYLQENITVEMWQFFCNAIKKSSIIHLDLCFVQACSHPVFDELWGIFCDSLEKSKIKSLNLQRMGLYNLTLSQWLKLYYAASQIKLESLDLTCNHLYNLSRVFSEEENYNNQPESWKVVCDLIKLPSLKNLKFKEDNLERLTQDGWMALCAAIKESNLETLDIGISGDESLPSDRWKQLLQALQIPSLKSLQLTHFSAKELSAPAVKELCLMIETSSLQSITLKHLHGNISLQAESWNMLGEAFKKRRIKSWDLGSIGLSEANLSGFFEGVKRSGVTTLHMRDYLNYLSLELWTKLTLWMKEAGIYTLRIALESNPTDWSLFCEFIVNTNIKSLIFNFQPSLEPKLQRIEQLGNAIKRSNLETLNLSFREHEMCLTHFNILLEGIKKSKINNLTFPNLISPAKSKALSDVMFVVNARAKHKNTLVGLCADTLFRKYNARLTGYDFELMSNQEVKKNTLYVELTGDALLRYKVIGSDDELKEDLINLSKINNLQVPDSMTLKWLKENKDTILKITSTRGHTRLTETMISYEDDKNLWEDTLLDGEKEVLFRVGIS